MSQTIIITTVSALVAATAIAQAVSNSETEVIPISKKQAYHQYHLYHPHALGTEINHKNAT